MDHTTVTKLSNLEAHAVEQTVALWVDSFFPMFKGISKDREALCRLFMPCIQSDLCYVLLQGKQVAGFVAVSDYNRRAIMILEDVCIATFGALKGKILAWQLRKMLSEPAVNQQAQGYIDFIATAPAFQRCGVATALLAHVERDTAFRWIYLDVLTTNHSAIFLYKKLGYTVDAVKNNIWMRFAGIKKMNVMKKELTRRIPQPVGSNFDMPGLKGYDSAYESETATKEGNKP